MPGAEMVIIDGADHSLETEAGVGRNLEILGIVAGIAGDMAAGRVRREGEYVR